MSRGVAALPSSQSAPFAAAGLVQRLASPVPVQVSVVQVLPSAQLAADVQVY